MRKYSLGARSLINLKSYYGGDTIQIKVCEEMFTLPSFFANFASKFLTKYFQENNVFEIKSNDEFGPRDLLNAFKLILSVFNGSEAGNLKFKEHQAAMYIAKVLRSEPLMRYFLPLKGERELFPIYTFQKIGEFTFSIGRYQFITSEIEALILSQKVKRLIIEEKVSTLNLSSSGFDEKTFISEFSTLLRVYEGFPLTINHKNAPIILSIGEQLDNQELIDICNDVLSGADPSFIESLASAFSTKTSDILSLPPNIIDSILHRPDLSVSSQNELIVFLLHYIEIHGPTSYFLLENVDFTKVDPAIARKCLESHPLPFITQKQVISSLYKEIEELRATIFKFESRNPTTLTTKEYYDKVNGNAHLTLDELKILILTDDPTHFHYLALLFRMTKLDCRDNLIQYLQKLTKEENPKGMVLLASSHLEGWNAPQDRHKAFQLFKKASDKNNAEAHFKLGVCFANGIGVQKDFKEAVKYYLKAFECGHRMAAYNLASCYSNGWGVPKDDSKAFAFSLVAFNKGFNNVDNLVYALKNGIGVKKDEELAGVITEQAKRKGLTIGRDKKKAQIKQCKKE